MFVNGPVNDHASLSREIIAFVFRERTLEDVRVGFKLSSPKWLFSDRATSETFLLFKEKGRVRCVDSFNETRCVMSRHVFWRLRRLVTSTHWNRARTRCVDDERRLGIQVSTGQFRKDARTWRRVLFAPLGHRENSLHTLGGNRARLNAPAALSNASLYEGSLREGRLPRVLPVSLLSPLYPHAACTTNVKTRGCPGEHSRGSVPFPAKGQV